MTNLMSAAWRGRSSIWLVAVAACVIVGCGHPRRVSTSTEPSAATADSQPRISTVDATNGTVPGPPAPVTPSDYGVWANGIPARSTPVSVQPGTSVEFIVDRFDPGSTVDVYGAGIRTTTTVDEQGRVEYSVDSGDLQPGVHEVHFSGNNGVAVGFTGRIRIPGRPAAGSDYATVLCCFEQPSDGTLIDDVPLRLLVNGTDLSEFFRPHLDDDGSVLVSIPVPHLGVLTITVVNETTGHKLEERVETQGP